MTWFVRRASSAAFLTILVGLLVGLTGTAVLAEENIASTRLGEIPTTGGMRPGPTGLSPSVVRNDGVRPVAIKIEKAQVDAEVEVIEIVDGIMQNPTGPWVVSWYKETAKLGEVGNAVMAGHLDYWDVGPAVFYNVGLLEPGDRLEVTGEDGAIYVYEVEWSELFDAATAPLQKIVGATPEESLTLITCGGPFDPVTGQYLQRLVVRAERVT